VAAPWGWDCGNMYNIKLYNNLRKCWHSYLTHWGCVVCILTAKAPFVETIPFDPDREQL